MRRPAANGKPRRAGAIWSAKLGGVVTLAALALGGCADMPVFHEPASFVGLATEPKEPQDFVKETRRDKTDFTPVGIEPAHPPSKPRDAAGVKQLQAELEAQRDAGHAILQKLSPEAAKPQTPEEQLKAKIAAKQKAKEDAAKKADKQAKQKPKDQSQGDAQAPQ
jgi:hypothetical protein